MEFEEFLRYIGSVASGCAGFIRSVGYLTHRPGLVILMDDQETFLVIINIPIIMDRSFTVKIGDIISYISSIDKYNKKAKEENRTDFKKIDEKEFFEIAYFTGYNIKDMHSIGFYNTYSVISNTLPIHEEEDIMNIPNISNYFEGSEAHEMNIVYGNSFYKIPVGKVFTNLNKGDTCSLKIYNHIYNSPIGCNTIRYTLWKKKLKLSVDIWFNILQLK